MVFYALLVWGYVSLRKKRNPGYLDPLQRHWQRLKGD
jgi:hypothetical protein